MKITELATLRRVIREGGHFWHDYDEKRSKKEFRKLVSVEDAIEKSAINGDANRLAAAEILLETHDGLEFADNFKARLYDRFKQRA